MCCKDTILQEEVTKRSKLLRMNNDLWLNMYWVTN